MVVTEGYRIEDYASLREALRPLADLAWKFKAYPQGLAGQDRLLGVDETDILRLRSLADAARKALGAAEEP